MKPPLLCARCERLPPTPEAGVLWVWLPVSHLSTKLRAALVEDGWPVTQAALADPIQVALGGRPMAALAAVVRGALNALERRDSRALLLAEGEGLSTQHFAHVSPLEAALEQGQAEWLVTLMRDDRLTSWFQPIVDAQDPSRIVAHEALLRAHDAEGRLVRPDRMFDAARSANLLFQLDLAARRSAVACAARTGLEGLLFINFSPAAIYDPVFCLRSTIQTVHQHGLRPEQIVFEVVESDQAAESGHLRRILDVYRAAGFRAALDDVGAGYSSLNLLHELRPDIIKLDMALVRGVCDDPFKAGIAEALLQMAQKVGVEVVAEGIEDLPTLQWFQARGVTYAQGYLFARPAPQPLRTLHADHSEARSA